MLTTMGVVGAMAAGVCLLLAVARIAAYAMFALAWLLATAARVAQAAARRVVVGVVAAAGPQPERREVRGSARMLSRPA